MNDPKLYREYQTAAGPTIQRAGGEVVAFDVAAETIEGTPPGPHTVIVKFESTEAAKAWYASAAYQAAVGKRLAATHGFAVISQSMNFKGAGSNQAYQCIENIMMNRATVAGIKSSPTAGFHLRGKANPSSFDVDALARTGR